VNLLNVRQILALSLFAIPLLLAGCGGGNVVTGKVTFPDGTPLERGRVVFDSGMHMFYGEISPDGTFTMEGAAGGRTIPSGTYGVFLMGTVRPGDAEAVDNRPTDEDGNPIGPEPRGGAPDIPLVAPRFTRKATSGLECVVNGRTEFNITVEKP